MADLPVYSRDNLKWLFSERFASTTLTRLSCMPCGATVFLSPIWIDSRSCVYATRSPFSNVPFIQFPCRVTLTGSETLSLSGRNSAGKKERSEMRRSTSVPSLCPKRRSVLFLPTPVNQSLLHETIVNPSRAVIPLVVLVLLTGTGCSDFIERVDIQKDNHADVTAMTTLAEQGNADAQTKLGDRLSDGAGVVEDHAGAAIWYRSGAEQGDAHGQTRLGLLYSKANREPQV